MGLGRLLALEVSTAQGLSWWTFASGLSVGGSIQIGSNGKDMHELTTLGVGFIVMPLNENIPLCDRVFYEEELPWDVIYLDEYSLVAANRENPESRRLGYCFRL